MRELWEYPLKDLVAIGFYLFYIFLTLAWYVALLSLPVWLLLRILRSL